RLPEDADRGDGRTQLVGDAGDEGLLSRYRPRLPREPALHEEQGQETRPDPTPERTPRGEQTTASRAGRPEGQREAFDVRNRDRGPDQGAGTGTRTRGEAGPFRHARALEQGPRRHLVAKGRPAAPRPGLDGARFGQGSPEP